MKNLIAIYFLLLSVTAVAQPTGYYQSALGKTGVALQNELKTIIDNHNIQSFPLWTSFAITDKRAGNIIWDIYSDIPGGTPNYTYTIGSDQCGQYNGEGDCYNHEHLWPKTYFNDALPMTTDLHHLVPTDGWVNNKRSNFPFDWVQNGSTVWTSSNGSATGSSTSFSNYSGKVFEPIDAFKGDIARIYFYMSTRYKGEDGSWKNWEMANGAELTSEAKQLLLHWHTSDPVSQKEIDRNNAVYNIQGNRNPFVDYPLFADCIFGAVDCTPLQSTKFEKNVIKIFPNPATNVMKLDLPPRVSQEDLKIRVYNTLGQPLLESSETRIVLNSLPSGVYYLQAESKGEIFYARFIKE
jgi:endonuclease I